MVRKKIDNRIRVMIENGVKTGHRTLFVIVGDKGRDQVVILHHMLSKAAVRARPSVLWCYKKELGFSSHRKKRMKQIQQKVKAGNSSINEDDPFELFVSSTKIRYCYYKETHKILGNTFGMCVLQDFEALTPNLLARTVETIEGGGLVIILLQNMSSLKQLQAACMDVHKRFRTEAHQTIVCRFNERFLLSLSSCERCLVVDDKLRVLPISSHCLEVSPVENSQEPSQNEIDLSDLKKRLQDTPLVGNLVGCCKTLDQAKAVLKFLESITEKTLRATVSLTASRGRGKSAALGLAVAAAVSFGYSNVFVTSPSPENLNTFFEFVYKGLSALEYEKHIDYDVTQSGDPEHNKATVKVNVFREWKQTIQYIQPTDCHRLSQAELLVIDEAAAIPLPFVRSLLGPYLVFLSSTVNGYEGTGRSLSLKLLQELKVEASFTSADSSSSQKGKSRVNSLQKRSLYEITLEEPIRYNPGDEVEAWLTRVLCLDSSTAGSLRTGTGNGPPPLEQCELYYINRDTLFSYHKATEAFLQRIVALYFASYYKNSPDDLQVMADAPGHNLFCLLGPVDPGKKSVPDVLVIIQVCLEGEISSSSIDDGLTKKKKIYGDLIPWTLAQQFQEPDFPKLCGVRIVRVATHPDLQGMGYGTKAIELLKKYYEQKIPAVDVTEIEQEMECSDEEADEDTIRPRKLTSPLLLKLSERAAEKVDYLGVMYGLTEPLLKFWKNCSFVPVYLKPIANELTGEHSCIMLYVTGDRVDGSHWLTGFWSYFRRVTADMLSFQFDKFPVSLVLSLLASKFIQFKPREITRDELEVYLSEEDLKRLEMYCNNLADFYFILDLIPIVARLCVLSNDVQLTAVQTVLLLGIGLQHRTVENIALELNLPAAQLLELYNSMLRKIVRYFRSVASNG